MDDSDFFLTETITVPIGFRLFAIAQLSLSYRKKYLAKWDRGLSSIVMFMLLVNHRKRGIDQDFHQHLQG